MSDVYEWLEAQDVYPKILIGDNAAVGCAAFYETAPEASDARIWGGMEFDGPWKGFWLPMREYGSDVERPAGDGFPERPHMDLGSDANQMDWVENVEHCLKLIEEGAVQKIVLARRSTVDGVDPYELLKAMRGGVPYLFQVSSDVTFVGCTPEHLFRREGRLIFIEAVAGTHTDPEVLLASDKNRREHAWVREDVMQKIESFCDSYEMGDVGIKDAGGICHLHSPFEGVLKGSVNDGQLLEQLHPTPAMGGVPWTVAKQWIAKLESFQRGWYAAPLGFYTKERAQFIVAIRCALLIKNKMHLFAGTGIVKGADPLVEWDELNHKTEAWRCKIRECSMST